MILQAVGEPEWPFGSASGRLVLKEGEDKISQTDFELHNDGASISSSCWKVTWHEDYVEIILSGEEQFDEQVILYFDGTKEIQQLTDVADIEVEYPSGERLDESRVITEQSFDVELNDWGEVQFVSYLPTYETLWEDVSFVLAKDNQIIYYFPECYENNSTENDSVGITHFFQCVPDKRIEPIYYPSKIHQITGNSIFVLIVLQFVQQHISHIGFVVIRDQMNRQINTWFQKSHNNRGFQKCSTVNRDISVNSHFLQTSMI